MPMQDNFSVTIDVFVPAGTLPSQLKLRLAKKRVTLLLRPADEYEGKGLPILRRQTYAPIEPRCTDCYTMPEASSLANSIVADADGRAVVRIVVYKAVKAGWLSLFVGDAAGQCMVPGPPQMSHAMAHAAALARAKAAMASEAEESARRALHASSHSAPQATWRTGCHIIRKKTPGGVKIHYGRNAPTRAEPMPETNLVRVVATGPSDDNEAPSRRRYCERREWGSARRQPPREDYWKALAEEEAAAAAAAAQRAADIAAYEAAVAAAQGRSVQLTSRDALEAGPAAEEEDGEGNASGERREMSTSRLPSRRDAAAARAAIEAVRKGEAPTLSAEQNDSHLSGGGDGGGYGDDYAGGGGDYSSDDDEHGGWEGEGKDPNEIDYPLPGSYASCDACGQCVDRYYHCVQCGVIQGFDLCEECHRRGLYPDKHLRRFPNHRLALVTKTTAPIIGKEPTLKQAPPAPPPPMPLPKKSTELAERVIIPFEAKVRYEWNQYSGEINLSIAIPQGTRARDLIVAVQPFQMSVSLKGYGIILQGSFHKGVRHRETVWTIEEGMLRVLLIKSDAMSWKKLFPHEHEMAPMEAIKQVCEDPEPLSHGYMDLEPEARRIVDMHRQLKHAMATGDYGMAHELEEEMKLMRFHWGKDKDHMQAG